MPIAPDAQVASLQTAATCIDAAPRTDGTPDPRLEASRDRDPETVEALRGLSGVEPHGSSSWSRPLGVAQGSVGAVLQPAVGGGAA
jgi:hypothetical protein